MFFDKFNKFFILLTIFFTLIEYFFFVKIHDDKLFKHISRLDSIRVNAVHKIYYIISDIMIFEDEIYINQFHFF